MYIGFVYVFNCMRVQSDLVPRNKFDNQLESPPAELSDHVSDSVSRRRAGAPLTVAGSPARSSVSSPNPPASVSARPDGAYLARFGGGLGEAGRPSRRPVGG